MDIEKLISAWKADEDIWEVPGIASPIGPELTEEELLEVNGGDCYITLVCNYTCNVTCINSCASTICETTNGCGNVSACCSCSLSGATAI